MPSCKCHAHYDVTLMCSIRGVRLREFKLRKIILGVRMHFHHIFPGCGGVWKPPNKIYSQYNGQCNKHNAIYYMLGFFSFLFLFPPSTSLSLLFILFSFNPSSFLIFYYFILFFYICSHIFFLFSSFLITKLKNAVYILIQLVQCRTSSH